jgi:hypothetical protein
MSGSDGTATKAPNRTSTTSNAKVHRMQRTGPHPPWTETGVDSYLGRGRRWGPRCGPTHCCRSRCVGAWLCAQGGWLAHSRMLSSPRPSQSGSRFMSRVHSSTASRQRAGPLRPYGLYPRLKPAWMTTPAENFSRPPAGKHAVLQSFSTGKKFQGWSSARSESTALLYFCYK